MSVSVLVPYRGDGASRDAAWAYVQNRWRHVGNPAWQLVVGAPPAGPWVKAAAVADALTRADGQVLVVMDADVLIQPAALEEAVGWVRQGSPWAVPHGRVHRLKQAVTELVLAGGNLPEPPHPAAYRRRYQPGHPTPPVRTATIRESYQGVPGGGLVVLTRDTYERAPMDPRFVGWGQEDTSWGRALRTLAGPPWRGTEPLWHLWHTAPVRRSRRVGTQDGYLLHRRYCDAENIPEAMTALLAEFAPAAASLGGCTEPVA